MRLSLFSSSASFLIFVFCCLWPDGEMLKMRVPLSISLLFVWLLSSADCSHFRGGSMSWKPTPNPSQVLCTGLYWHCTTPWWKKKKIECKIRMVLYLKSNQKIIQLLWKGGGGRGGFLLIHVLNDEQLA